MSFNSGPKLNAHIVNKKDQSVVMLK